MIPLGSQEVLRGRQGGSIRTWHTNGIRQPTRQMDGFCALEIGNPSVNQSRK